MGLSDMHARLQGDVVWELFLCSYKLSSLVDALIICGLTVVVHGCSYAIKKKDEIERVAKANR